MTDQTFTQAKIINKLVAFLGFQSVDELQSYLAENDETLDAYQSDIIDFLSEDFDLADFDFIFPAKPAKKATTKPTDPVDPITPIDTVKG